MGEGSGRGLFLGGAGACVLGGEGTLAWVVLVQSGLISCLLGRPCLITYLVLCAINMFLQPFWFVT